MRRKTQQLVYFIACQIFIVYIIWSLFFKPTQPTGSHWTTDPQGVDLPMVGGDQPKEKLLPVTESAEIHSEITSVFLLYMPSTQADGIQNLLLRKAISKNVKVALPKSNKETLCYPEIFTEKCPINYYEAPFNMVIHQLRYEKSAIAPALKPEARRIVLIRHPIAHLQALYYDNNWEDYANGQAFNSFINGQYKQLAKGYDFDKHLPYSNSQLFTLGLAPSLYDNRQAVIQKIDKISKEFDLVLVQEYMPESLVLFKHELDWPYEEVVLFSLHSRPENYRLEELDKQVNKTIIYHNEADMRMYEMLSKRFLAKISEFGEEKMKQEKAKLQKAIDKETEHCLKKTADVPVPRTDLRLSWDGESDRHCHYHISRGSELTTFLRISWEKRDMARKNKMMQPVDAQHD